MLKWKLNAYRISAKILAPEVNDLQDYEALVLLGRTRICLPKKALYLIHIMLSKETVFSLLF